MPRRLGLLHIGLGLVDGRGGNGQFLYRGTGAPGVEPSLRLTRVCSSLHLKEASERSLSTLACACATTC
jgi:hypothetical protein